MSEYIWLNKDSRKFLQQDYLDEGETPEQRIDVIANAAERILGKPGFAYKFKQCMKKGWFSLASPIWSNFGKKRALPISCFGSYITDDTHDILSTQLEVGMMSKYGGGTSAYFGNLRPRGSGISDGGQSAGPVHFMQLFNTCTNVISQGKTRRGSFAGYLPIEHPDVMEFLAIKSPGNPIQDMSFGVTVTDSWLFDMKDGDKAKRKIWAKVLERRNDDGYPYIIFIDTFNKNTVKVYKDKGLRIWGSNLCTEIGLPSSDIWSFVCDLSSMNILFYDDWKETDAIEILVYLLDAVMTEFIEKASRCPGMEKAVRFAKEHRALGVGWLGWHSYLQSHMIPVESMEAKRKNVEIAKKLYDDCYAASRKLAVEYGEPEIMKGYGQRNATLLAIAPTTSSSFILGAGKISKGIELFQSNYYIDDLAKGKFTFKNDFLIELLATKDVDVDKTMDNILKHQGSVQHLDCLTQQEKDVFKTHLEVSPMEIVIQAAQRQKYIDQAQSLNIMINPAVTPIKDLNTLYLTGHELEIKSFYYQKNVNAAQQLGTNILRCSSCEA